MGDVFISYAREDRPAAERIARFLVRSGFSVWWDREIPVGRAFDDVIEERLHLARCVVVLWSSSSIQSEWVKTEAMEGAERQILLPALIEQVRIPLAFRRLQTVDLCAWNDDSDTDETLKLLVGVKRLLGTSPAAVSEASGPAQPVSESPSPPPVHEPVAPRGVARNADTGPLTASDPAPTPEATPRPRKAVDPALSTRVEELVTSAKLGDVRPRIPTTKERNARQSCGVPGGEKVLALIDCTLWGSARDAVVFGEHAMYFHNGTASGKLPYKDLRGRTIKAGGCQVDLDRGMHCSLSGATDDGHTALVVAKLLRRLAELYSGRN